MADPSIDDLLQSVTTQGNRMTITAQPERPTPSAAPAPEKPPTIDELLAPKPTIAPARPTMAQLAQMNAQRSQAQTVGTRAPMDFDLGHIGTAGAFGAGLGALTPEMLEGAGYWIGKLPDARAKAAGLGLQTIAQLPVTRAIGTRAGQALTGALGGLASEAGGQGAEMFTSNPFITEGVRMGAGIVAPEFPAIAARIAKGFDHLMGGMKASSFHTEIEQALGRKLKTAERQYFDQMLSRIQGADTETRKALYAELERGAEQIRAGVEPAQRQEILATKLATREAGEARSAVDDVLERLAPAQTATQSGTAARDRILKNHSEEALMRREDYQAQKKVVDDIVRGRESAGEFIEQSPLYMMMRAELDKILLNPQSLEAMVQPTAKETVPSILSAYREIEQGLTGRRVKLTGSPEEIANMVTDLSERGIPLIKVKNPETGLHEFYREFPSSFDAIDTLRRKLGDVAFGKPEEGFAAIGQERARNWYEQLTALQLEYAGEAFDTLQRNYSVTSRLIDRYRGKRGRELSALDRLNPEEFAKDPSAIPASFFKSFTGVDDLLKLTGDPALVAQQGKEYIQRQLANKRTGDSVSSWWNREETQDMFSHPQMKELRNWTEDYISRLRGAERAEALAKELGQGLPNRLQVIQQTANERAALILGAKTEGAAEARIRDLLQPKSPNMPVWQEVGPIIAQSAAGQKHIASAVGQMMADLARTNSTTAPIIFRENLRPALEANGLMSPQAMDSLYNQLVRISQSDIARESKVKMSQMLAANFVRSYLGYGAARAVDATALKSEGLRYMGP